MAQVRMLGGSIGIAASTAILGTKQRNAVLTSGLLTPQQLQSLRDALPTLNSAQQQIVQQTYTDAFNDTMVACAIIASICVLVTAGVWQRNPPSMEERRRQQGMNEAMRQQAIGERRARAVALKEQEKM